MEKMTVLLYNTDGETKGEIKLDSSVFNDIINTSSVYQTVKSYMANQRKGLASTKTRGEVSGGGRKPWKQKGTGRARAGSTRSPLWRHGGVTFGPLPRDFSTTLPKKVRDLALKSVINAKIKDKRFFVLDDLTVAAAKTKMAVAIFSKLKIDVTKDKILLLVDKLDDTTKRALHNLCNVRVTAGKNTNAYEVLRADKLVITEAGLSGLTERLKA
ncbi:MAG: 50S ribosomal protein L4 [Candidatus Omnitrophica bacterium]|nr:50S ribosomal protein L4 [Candidatus Omnitrophota bacterium]